MPPKLRSRILRNLDAAQTWLYDLAPLHAYLEREDVRDQLSNIIEQLRFAKDRVEDDIRENPQS